MQNRNKSFNSKKKNLFDLYLDKSGIQINGHNPWDIQVHNDAVYDAPLSKKVQSVLVSLI